MASEWPSREITWEMGINAPELVMREIDAIDTKSMFAFATGTLYILAVRKFAGPPDPEVLREDYW